MQPHMLEIEHTAIVISLGKEAVWESEQYHAAVNTPADHGFKLVGKSHNR